MSFRYVIPFNFETSQVRVITDDQGSPWFVAKDVCTAIGIEWKGAINCRSLDDDEHARCVVDTTGGQQEVMIISESGLYTLILRSHAATLPGMPAHRFRRWVTSNVLPAVRKHGSFHADDSDRVRALELEISRLNVTVNRQRAELEVLKRDPDGARRLPVLNLMFNGLPVHLVKVRDVPYLSAVDVAAVLERSGLIQRGAYASDNVPSTLLKRAGIKHKGGCLGFKVGPVMKAHDVTSCQVLIALGHEKPSATSFSLVSLLGLAQIKAQVPEFYTWVYETALPACIPLASLWDDEA